MSRTNPALLFGVLLVVAGGFAGLSLSPGQFTLGIHERDVLHLLDIVMRMAGGQTPHVDFQTPLGALAFLPIVVFVDAGWGVGMSILLSQVLVAAILLPAIWWAAWTRLGGIWAHVFGVAMIVMILALIYGDATKTTAFSMHYNRWAWAASFVAALLAVRPAIGAASARIDGAIIGLALGCLALTKVTYFVGFAPAIALALLVRRDWAAIGAAMAAGLLVAVAATAVYGIAYWAAYLGDLLSVTQSAVRSKPGDSFFEIMGAPRYLGGTIVLLSAVILLRRAGREAEGAALLFLAPALFYVTYQNFGNDPQWLILLAVLLLAGPSVPQSDPPAGSAVMAQRLTIAGAMALILSAPSFFNMVLSPFHHRGFNLANYTPLLPNDPVHDDLLVHVTRAYGYLTHQYVDAPEVPAEFIPESFKPYEPTVFRGETLPSCEVGLGSVVTNLATVFELERLGVADRQIMVADAFSSYWLFGNIEPLKGGTPWYYSGLPGFENAEFLMVPFCPSVNDARRQILRLVEERGAVLEEVSRSDQTILLRIADHGAAAAPSTR